MKRFLCFFLVLAALLSQAVQVRATDFVVRQRIVLPVVQTVEVAPVFYAAPLVQAVNVGCVHHVQAVQAVVVQRVQVQRVQTRQVIRTRTVIR